MGDLETRKWHTFYPVYINAKKTQSEGRRVSKPKAVDNPTLNDITAALRKLTLQFKEEPNKAYSRDFTLRGRVKVRLIDENKTPYVATIKNKKQLLLEVAKLIQAVKKTQPAASSQNTGGKKKRNK
eukprot:TRINITY_DN3319_c0_g1_i2.p1 TRINITY_DN3319_c0_g1~~TRINITY_DN3319_c0_g1_i2.p1  ORF type:complete len:126 (+),score=23.58 TRINITY_DN3319_c0_g1_i2:122-499(+)